MFTIFFLKKSIHTIRVNEELKFKSESKVT